MRNTLFSLLALAAAAAYAQPQPNMDVCKLMSPEEMKLCLASKPGADVRGAYCDQVPQSAIEKCLAQPADQAPASGGSTAIDPKDEAKSERTPERAATPRDGTK